MSKNKSFVQEIFHYLKKEKKYWLIPMIAILAIFAGLVIVAETLPIVSPFIYTLF